jgi:hypothetical protein
VAERLRALLEHPLDPRAARAITVLATAILIGFAAVVALGSFSHGRSSISRSRHPAPSFAVAPTPAAGSATPATPKGPAARPRQDPQDRQGSADAARAKRELSTHRALQHVPYRRGAVRIALVGASGSLALLRVEASTLAAARRGWHAFLRRYRDSGRAYRPLFRSSGGKHG